MVSRRFRSIGLLHALAVVVALVAVYVAVTLLVGPATIFPVGVTIAWPTGSMGHTRPFLALYADLPVANGDIIIYRGREGYLQHVAVRRTADGWLTTGRTYSYLDQRPPQGHIPRPVATPARVVGVVVVILPLWPAVGTIVAAGLGTGVWLATAYGDGIRSRVRIG